MLSKKYLNKAELVRTEKVVSDYERRYNRKLTEEKFIDDFVILDFMNYLKEPLSKSELLEGDLNWDNYFGLFVDSKDVDYFSKWKVLAPLSDFHMTFIPVVGYKVSDDEYLIGGRLDYRGSELNIGKALNNYKTSYKRLYGRS